MLVYKARLRPMSPWVTPWHSSTLWGALCWALSDILTPGEFAQWLGEARDGHPRFVVSDGFPAGLLPFPAGIVARSGDHKTKPVWVTQETFREFSGTGSAELVPAAVAEPPFKTSSMPHASIGRESNTTDDGGGLFEIDARSFRREYAERHELDVYMGVEEGNSDALVSAWKLLAMCGFGRHRSSGMGAFDLAAELERLPWLEERSSARGFMALSHFVPASGDPVEGSWRLSVSYPKFQGDRVQHFLKGRIIYLAPGALFRGPEGVRPYYGLALDVSRDEFPGAVHGAFCLAAPLQAPWWGSSD